MRFGHFFDSMCTKPKGASTLTNFCPILKMCQINCLWADYLSKKLPTYLTGLATVAESSDWLAWPDGPSTKTISAEFKGQLIWQGGTHICKEVTIYLQSRDTYLHKRTHICGKLGVNCARLRTLGCTTHPLPEVVIP